MTVRLIVPALLLAVTALGCDEQVPPPREDFHTPSKTEKKPAAPGVEDRLAALEKQMSALVTEMQALRRDLKTAGKTTEGDTFCTNPLTKAITLKNAKATESADLLRALLNGKEAHQVRVEAIDMSNIVLVQAPPNLADMVEAVLTHLDERAGKTGGDKTKPKAKAKSGKEDALKKKIAALEGDVAQLRDRADWAKRMEEKGFLDKLSADVDLRKMKDALDLLQKARETYKSFTEEAPSRPNYYPNEPKKK